MIAKSHSILFIVPKTSFPIPSPNPNVIPGAWNLSQASIKLMAQMNPIQINTTAKLILKNFITEVFVGCFYGSIRFSAETFPPSGCPAIWLNRLFFLHKACQPFQKIIPANGQNVLSQPAFLNVEQTVSRYKYVLPVKQSARNCTFFPDVRASGSG